MYKKVMVAIDDSEISRGALQEAVQIATAYGARLSIVHAVQGAEDDSAGSRRRGAAQLLEQAMSAAGNNLAAESRVLEAEADLGISGIPEAIAGAVTEWGADLLVVGSQGRRGLQRLVIGSVAEQLISEVGISIFLVRLH
ncbi:MAG: universal stress protein [Nitrosospira sp.]|nr:universal stress protein [Nitrosospira sp.]